MATDIKEVFPDRQVTVLHSRLQLLPAFSKDLHDAGSSLALAFICPLASNLPGC